MHPSFIAIAATFVVSPAFAQTTTRASVSTAGVGGNDKSSPVSLSRDGRHLAFTSYATNLVAGDTNNVRDCFVRDLVANTTIRVSTSAAGAQGDQLSDSPTLSGDGRYVVFASSATNLVGGDTNAVFDVFRKDTQTGAILRLSVSTAGAQSNAASFAPVASYDGAIVAYSGPASNLVASDTNNRTDVFVRNIPAGTTTRVSVSSAGAQANNDSNEAAISADGRYVVFSSDASNLVAGDTNNQTDVFLHDRQSGATTRVSLSSAGAQGGSFSDMGDISPDGDWIAFRSNATNLVASDTNAVADVFVRDLATGTTTRVSVGAGGAQGNGGSFRPRLSTNARVVSFQSESTNLVAGDTNAALDVYVRDRLLGVTERASVSTAGVQGNGGSFAAWISADGRVVAFESTANNLVAGDTNNDTDAFARTRACPAPITYCTAGTTSNGCVPVISSSGTPSASAPAGFTLQVVQVEGQKSALFFYGLSGRKAAPWGGANTSYLCVQPPTQRSPVLATGGTAGACNGAVALDWNAFIAANPSALGAPFAIGTIVDAQLWFRDPAAPQTTNLSNAIEFVVCN